MEGWVGVVIFWSPKVSRWPSSDHQVTRSQSGQSAYHNAYHLMLLLISHQCSSGQSALPMFVRWVGGIAVRSCSAVADYCSLIRMGEGGWLVNG